MIDLQRLKSAAFCAIILIFCSFYAKAADFPLVKKKIDCGSLTVEAETIVGPDVGPDADATISV